MRQLQLLRQLVIFTDEIVATVQRGDTIFRRNRQLANDDLGSWQGQGCRSGSAAETFGLLRRSHFFDSPPSSSDGIFIFQEVLPIGFIPKASWKMPNLKAMSKITWSVRHGKESRLFSTLLWSGMGLRLSNLLLFKSQSCMILPISVHLLFRALFYHSWNKDSAKSNAFARLADIFTQALEKITFCSSFAGWSIASPVVSLSSLRLPSLPMLSHVKRLLWIKEINTLNM